MEEKPSFSLSTPVTPLEGVSGLENTISPEFREALRMKVSESVNAAFREPDVWMERYVRWCFRSWAQQGELRKENSEK